MEKKTIKKEPTKKANTQLKKHLEKTDDKLLTTAIADEGHTEAFNTENETNKYWQIRLPKFKFQSASLNVYLVFVLVVFAFLLGMLVNKVTYLETQLKTSKADAAVNTNQPTNAQAAQPTAPPYEQVDNGHFPVLGDNNAKVTIVEFGDLRCPFCKQFFTDSEAQVKKDYVDTGKAKFAFRSYAFLGPASTMVANAAECANEQGKFWDFHDYLYQNQPSETDTSMYTVDNLTQIAGNLGMNTTQFQSCLSTNKDAKNLADDMAAAAKAQVDGTPTFFINGNRIVGAVPYSDPAGGQDLKTAIDAALAKAK